MPQGALTKRAETALKDARLGFQWLDPLRTAVKNKADGTLEWWTFAGAMANACLTATLRNGGVTVRRFDNFSVTFGDGSLATVTDGIERVRSGEWPALLPPISDEALEGLKFSACLPEPLARSVLQQRAKDQVAIDWVRRAPHVAVSIQPNGGSN